MSEPSTDHRSRSDRSGITDAVRVQMLATEHWSLLATRSMTWNDGFSRVTTFLTLLSAAVVALALVAQATNFGPGFGRFALVVLPVVLLVGVATYARLGQINADDFGLVIGMNRLRHAYIELAPELAPYFVTGHHDDEASVMQTYGLGYRLNFSRTLSATPPLVGAINVVLAGVLADVIADTLGVPSAIRIGVSLVTACVAAVGHVVLAWWSIASGRRTHQPRFPRG